MSPTTRTRRRSPAKPKDDLAMTGPAGSPQLNELAKADPDQQPSTALTPRAATFTAVESALRERQDRLVSLLGRKVPVDRFIRVGLAAMQRQPRLFDCTPASIVKALMDAAELQLEPTGLMGQAYLVPYGGEAQLIVGYRGLAELARRSGDVTQVEARVVRARDTFSVEYGTSPTVHHVPYLPGLMGNDPADTEDPVGTGPGDLRAVYAVLTFAGGGQYVEVMSAAEVEAIRRRSRAQDKGPWVTDPLEMARKTVLRRALKYAPLSVVDSRAAEQLDREDQREYGTFTAGLAEPQAERPPILSRAQRQLRAAAKGQVLVEDVEPVNVTPDDAPGTSQDAPGAAEGEKPTEDITTQAEPPGRAPECGELSPYNDDLTCTLEAGHDGNHSATAHGGGTW